MSGTLPTVAQAGCDLYLAWNISVASGDAAQAAMALGIDNVSFAGSLPPVPTAQHYIYALDHTSWEALGLYAWGDSELFGAWPGESWVEEVELNGEVFKKFLLDAEGGNYHLIFNNWNNGKQLPDYDIVADRDYYFIIDDEQVIEIESPQSGVMTIESLGDRTVTSVKYVNLTGQTSNAPFDGMNIVVTRYSDGTTSVIKVLK